MGEHDRDRGLYKKFIIQRTDGSSGHGGKHEQCCYFVLDLVHDPHADAAIEAYADACEHEQPALAADLRKWLRRNDWLLLKVGEIPASDSRRPFP
jgi:hypothetical protein